MKLTLCCSSFSFCAPSYLWPQHGGGGLLGADFGQEVGSTQALAALEQAARIAAGIQEGAALAAALVADCMAFGLGHGGQAFVLALN